MKTCPTCEKVYADKYRSCPSCAGARFGSVVLRIATWAPFCFIALLAVALLQDPGYRAVGMTYSVLAASIFPPAFRWLKLPIFAKVPVAVLLFVAGIAISPHKNAPAKRENVADQAVNTDQTFPPSPAISPKREPQTDSPPNTRTIKSDGAIGCVERSRFEQLVKLVSDGDKEAWKQSVLAAFLSEECIPMKAGDVVYIQDTAIFSGLVQVRRQGETRAYWTNLQQIRN